MYEEATERLERLVDQARETDLREPTAMTLATVGEGGQPSARVVLLKDIDERGLVFYTNYKSRKGLQLEANPRAALCFFWQPTLQQVRVEGRVERVSAETSDAYFATRPRGSQIGAWASRQSRELDAIETLKARFDAFEARFEGEEVPRPDFWGGYRLIPERFEFWSAGEHRLHDRIVYELADGEWTQRRLYP